MRKLFKSLVPILLVVSMIFTMGIEGISIDNPIPENKTKQQNVKAPPKAEEPRTEEPKSEESKGEEPKTEEPKTEEPKSEESKGEEPKGEEPKAEEPKSEESKGEESKGEESKAEEPKTEEPKDLEELESEESEEPEVEKPTGSIEITNRVRNPNKKDKNKEFDIFINGPDKSLYTISLTKGESLKINNLKIGDYTISTIIPMNYGLVRIENKAISITSKDLDKETTIIYELRNKSWFYSE